jgi:AcrR family transcriptional regulator
VPIVLDNPGPSETSSYEEERLGGERLGLRERKKRATRLALHSAALRLVAERGFEAVTIEDIATAAEVSPRTFFNYFGSKEDVIVNPDPDRVERLRLQLRQHAREQSLLTVIEDAMVTILGEVSDRRDEWLMRLQLVREIPALTPRYLAAFDAMEQVIAEDASRRTGRDTATDVYPRLVASLSVSTTRTAIAFWGASDGQSSLADSIHRAFSVLRDGLDAPG